jgi:hypothetical protein
MSPRTGLLVGSLLTAALGGYFGAPFALPGADKRAMLPGRTSRGHHLIEAACSTCHTPFRGVSSEACLRCHEGALAAAEDSHPQSKFLDPRNAERTAGLDARACVTCHREHVPDRTREGGVTLPADFCSACHQDIGHERPSHADFSFEGCASVGCHRFHDNRALYEGFLARHLHEPEVLPSPRVPLRGLAAPRPPGAVADADAPLLGAPADEAIVHAWQGSAHARAGVACTPCHGVQDTTTGMIEWKDRPGSAGCARCHASAAAGFAHGQHGMRATAGLSPLTPALARLPMRPEARDRELGCDACHTAHAYDTRRAAVEACLGCHDDRHSRAYRASRHYLLWQREVAGAGAPGTGVSCATCHLPREVIRTRGADLVRVDHDQNDNLRPRDKMVRSVCLACHGLGFTLDALADADLVDRNFNGRPAVHVPTLDMVERRTQEGGVTR